MGARPCWLNASSIRCYRCCDVFPPPGLSATQAVPLFYCKTPCSMGEGSEIGEKVDRYIDSRYIVC
ncbi:MAG: hypothetical protein Kow00124_29540 [Anaerolineae bacterium]